MNKDKSERSKELRKLKRDKTLELEHTTWALKGLGDRFDYTVKTKRVTDEQKENELKRISHYILRIDHMFQEKKQTKIKIGKLLHEWKHSAREGSVSPQLRRVP